MNKQTRHELIGAAIMLALIAGLACMALDLCDREAVRQAEQIEMAK